MAVFNSEIDSLKHDIEKSKAEMNLLCLQLGETAFQWHSCVSCPNADDAYSVLQSAIEQKKEVEKSINAVTNALDDVNSSDKEIEKSKLTVRNLDKRHETLVASLGAIAVEAYNASNLPDTLDVCMSAYCQWSSKLKSIQSKSETDIPLLAIIRTKLTDYHRKKINSVFYTVGKEIFKRDMQALVPGSRADHVIAELDKIQSMKLSLRNLISSKQTEINNAQSSLHDMGILGMESRKLRELETKDKQLAQNLDDLYTQYGTILANEIDSWLASSSPEQLQKICLVIKDQMRRIREQNINLRLCELERDIDIHQAQKDQYNTQLTQLEDQLRLINKHRSELSSKIAAETSTIVLLRDQQQQIADSYF